MTRQRCDGLMVREQYDSLEFDSAGYETSGWRCLNCGAIVDPVIATRGQTTRKPQPDHLSKQRLKEPVMMT